MNMAFDLSKLRTNFGVAEVSTTPDGRMTTVAQPTPAVAINRPASQRPVVAPAEALTVTTIEGSAAAHALVEFVDTEGEEAAPEVAPEPPKARRGRPRKTAAPNVTATLLAAATAAGVTDGTAGRVVGDADPKAPAGAPAPTASGCAPSVGDLAAAVSALIDAVRALECYGKTGVFLEAAFAALRGDR